jgi:His-Xaa-Ser system protein HxsD
MKVAKIDKDACQEIVLRKALYWLSKECDWVLDKTDTSWVVKYESEDNLEPLINRLINDQILRNDIDRNTGHLREKIIHKVLSDISSRE